MNKTIILIFSILYSLNIVAENQQFIEANNLYANKQYKEAIVLYDSILTTGQASAELYYNIGNCYYKNQDWANAIWNYEKSLQLNNNTLTIENLELSRLKITDKIESIPQLFYKKWWLSISSIFNTYTWAIISIILIWLYLIFWLLNNYFSKNTTILKKGFFYLVALSFSLTLSSYQNTLDKNEGIIFHSAINVLSAPDSSSTILFSLHSGTKVMILDQIGNWIHIKITDGNKGWISKNSLKQL